MTLSRTAASLSLALSGCCFLAAHASAQTITEWNFNSGSNTIAVNTSPATSTGTGTASTLGMANSYTGTATKDISDVNTSTPLSSDPGTGNQQWRIRAGDATTGVNGTTTNGWSSLAPIGTQGAQFLSSTLGYNNIQVSFDWSPTSKGEQKLQLEYTLDGTNYVNVGASLFTNLPSNVTALTNTASANTVSGGYLLYATNNAVYANGITANLSSISGAANDPNFGIRLVNATTGADNTDTTGAALNNTSGNWRFDEVTISGTVTPAPEPSTYAAVLVGAAGIFAVRRLRRARA